jgi:hypothetical protein
LWFLRRSRDATVGSTVTIPERATRTDRSVVLRTLIRAVPDAAKTPSVDHRAVPPTARRCAIRPEEAVAEPVHIEIESAVDGRDLVDTLARRGLVGRLLTAGSHWEIEIHSPHEETQRLLLDLEPALENWLADQHRIAIPLRVGPRALLVRGERSSSSEFPDGSPSVMTPVRETGAKGEGNDNDREMEPVA